MVATSLLLSLASAVTLACAKPAPHPLVVHERREAVPKGFVSNGAASGSTPLTLRIALVSNDMAGLEKALYDVSTPSSDLYGQHLSKEEVEAFVAPSSESTTAVNEWLAANDLTASPISPAGDWISFSIDVQKANELFDADFSTFTHQATGTQTIRTLSYSIPASLKDHIELVHPTIAFPVLTGGLPVVIAPLPEGTNLTAEAVPASCATLVTPACLQALYGIPASVPAQTASKIGVSGFIEQFAQSADLRSFLTTFRTDIASTTTFTLQTLDGGSNPQATSDAGIEANLDTQYTVGVAGGVPVTFISVGENNPDGIDGFLDIINTLIAETSPPQVLTTSYGFDEPELTATIANNLCNAYAQLGARGVSILFSSGDGGVSGSQSQSCTTFIPTFPSGCPFLTSVGATTGTTEVAATFSSGGFSDIFAAPSYQSSAVATYLTALGSTNSGKFTPTGRAFPDVAAQGENVVIFDGGEEGTVAGTSCSSPIFASTIGLLNAELIAAGKSPLGFLNPFIYANPTIFNDITSGDNPGCGTNGFPVRAGWDPVTGFGTPNFAKLRTAAGLT